MPSPRPQYLRDVHSIAGAAKILGTSRAGAYRLVQAGNIKIVFVGTSMKITDAAIAEFCASRAKVIN